MRDFCCMVWTPTTAAIPWWARHDYGVWEARRLPRETLKPRESHFFPIRTQEIPGSLNFPGQIDVV